MHGAESSCGFPIVISRSCGSRCSRRHSASWSCTHKWYHTVIPKLFIWQELKVAFTVEVYQEPAVNVAISVNVPMSTVWKVAVVVKVTVVSVQSGVVVAVAEGAVAQDTE